jgi:hypothetical protein
MIVSALHHNPPMRKPFCLALQCSSSTTVLPISQIDGSENSKRGTKNSLNFERLSFDRFCFSSTSTGLVSLWKFDFVLGLV